MAKRGPKSVAGRAAVRLNALRHGIFADSPVVAALEDEGDWQEHLQGTLDSLDPQGHLEQELAQRVALLLWRLRRVARYERQAIEIAQRASYTKFILNDIHRRWRRSSPE